MSLLASRVRRVAFATVPFIWAAFAPAAPTAQPVRYRDAKVGWVIQLPAGFKRNDKRGGEKARVAFFGPVENKYTTNIFILSGSVGRETATSLGKASLAQAVKEKGVRLVQQLPVTVAGTSGYAWLVARRLPNGQVVGQRQVVFVRRGLGVVLTLTAEKDAMPKWDAAFAKSLKTFRWK